MQPPSCNLRVPIRSGSEITICGRQTMQLRQLLCGGFPSRAATQECVPTVNALGRQPKHFCDLFLHKQRRNFLNARFSMPREVYRTLYHSLKTTSIPRDMPSDPQLEPVRSSTAPSWLHRFAVLRATTWMMTNKVFVIWRFEQHRCKNIARKATWSNAAFSIDRDMDQA